MSLEIHLPVDVYNLDQASSLLLDLHQYASDIRSAAIRAKVKVKDDEKPEASPLLISLINGCGVDVDDAPALDSLHKQLLTALKTAPIMHLTLSAMPGRKLKRQLIVWFRTQIHPLSLLTFTARGDIGGGLILQAGSHLYDYSFRERILANPKRIGELAGV
jgi:hypothetical protein